MFPWIIDQILFWWVVSFLLVYFYWHRRREHWGMCLFSAFLGAGLIELPILLTLQLIGFIFSYLPLPEHLPHLYIPLRLLRL